MTGREGSETFTVVYVVRENKVRDLEDGLARITGTRYMIHFKILRGVKQVCRTALLAREGFGLVAFSNFFLSFSEWQGRVANVWRVADNFHREALYVAGSAVRLSCQSGRGLTGT